MNLSGRERTLVLITSSFPFGRGEQFLESEVDALAKVFRKVIVVPQKITDEARALPENFVVETGFGELVGNEGLVRRTLAALFYSFRTNNFPPGNIKGVKAHLIASYYALRSEQYFSRFIRSRGLDVGSTVFYSYWFYPVVIGLASIKRVSVDKKMLVVTRAHGSDVYESVHGIDEFPYRKKIIGDLNNIFCISENGASHIQSKYGAKKVKVSRLGSRLPRRYPERNLNKITIVSCSSINEIKRVSLIFHALNFFAMKFGGKQIRWFHLGSGPLEAQLRSETQKNPAKNLEVTIMGAMSNDDVHRFYEETYADCFINLSTSEGVPVSIMEAMSYRIPVVATDVGGVSEIVKNGSGVLVDPDVNLENIAAAIEVLVMGALQDTARQRAYCVWEENYNAEKNYSQFADFLFTTS